MCCGLVPISQAADNSKSNTQALKSYIEIGLGYNSNPLLYGDAFVSSASAGNGAADLMSQFAIGTRYKFIDAQDYDAKVIFDYFKEGYQTTNDADYSSTAITLPFNAYRDKTRLRIKPFYISTTSGGLDFLTQYGMEAEVTQKLGDYRLSMAITGITYQPDDISFAQLDGDSKRVEVKLSYPRYSSSLYVSLSHQKDSFADTETTTNSYSGLNLKSGYTHFNENINWNFILSLRSKEYDAEKLSGFVRRDNSYSFSVGPSLRVTDMITLTWLNSYSENNSNQSTAVDDKNYTQFISSLSAAMNY